MDQRARETVESWDSRPFSGHGGLYRLAQQGFSGAALADGSWLFMLNGRVVGVFDGSLDDFEDADGTVYAAPDPSLPLLFAMREQGGTTKAQYYSEDTPLAEADETLSTSNFTGYVELSENVLSGDYYVVYYGGQSMSVAFVGASGELVTDEEAFDLASDEVGIYEVVQVPIEVADVPEPNAPADAVVPGDADDDAPPGATDDSNDTSAADGTETASDESPGADEAGRKPGTTSSDVEEAEPEPDSAVAATDPLVEEAAPDDDGVESSADAETDVTTDSHETPATDVGTAETRVGGTSGQTPADDETERQPAERAQDADVTAGGNATGVGADDGSHVGDAADEGADDASPTSDEVVGASTSGGGEREVFEQERAWREATSIPALDPEESAEPDERRRGGPAANPAGEGPRRGPAASVSTTSRKADEAADVGQLRTALDERTDQLARLRERLAAIEGERDELRAERDELAGRVETLTDEVERLRTALDAADAGGAAGPGSLAPTDALEGTDLFIRYDSRGEPTLADAHDGASPDAVTANLRLDYHTRFDAEEVTVQGTPFDAYLRETIEYGFVSWLVGDLLYEIRDTGHASGLRKLYDALPDVDRAELRGTVDVETEHGSESCPFDVVLRDRMGTPLIVAELNTDRDPVTGDEMAALAEAASGVAAEFDLAAAVYVTASFFEPAALETATEATGGGFLNRGSRRSFVKTGRKDGFHLCLAETRGGSFYLTVPEL